ENLEVLFVGGVKGLQSIAGQPQQARASNLLFEVAEEALEPEQNLVGLEGERNLVPLGAAGGEGHSEQLVGLDLGRKRVLPSHGGDSARSFRGRRPERAFAF